MPTRTRVLLVVVSIVFGFIGAVALAARPPDPETRLPEQERLAGLIRRQQQSASSLRAEVARLRAEVAELRGAGAGRQVETSARERDLQRISLVSGLVAVRGPGLRVTLNDSDLEESPSGNVNDLVVHSEDVQAVVNALWRAGAEAVSLNGQRLVSVSAVLCVGNTLLVNGTVHSPPYVAVAVGASRERFDEDALVRRLRRDAAAFGLRFSITRDESLQVAPYRGAVAPRYARPQA